VLWVLLLGKVDVGFGAFVVVFVAAQVVGVISRFPAVSACLKALFCG